MKLKILIIDDDHYAIKGLLAILTEWFSSWTSGDKRDEFESVESTSVEAAEILFDKAERERRLYDIVFLDLKLPRRSGGIEKEEHGFGLLESIKKTVAREIVVYSNYPKPDNIRRAFLSGATDFIDKSVNVEERKNRITPIWQKLLDKERLRIFDQRIKELIPYAERHLAHLFSTSFTSLVQSVSHTTEGLRTYAGERYGLDARDSHDYMMRHLRMQEEAVGTAKREWKERQAAFTDSGKKPKPVSVEKILRDISEDIRLCLVGSRVELFLPEGDSPEVLSFDHEVQAMLREIIIGGLVEPTKPGEARKIRVEVKIRNRRIELVFIDDLKALAPNEMKSINEGFNFIPDDNFGRAWGLSIVQFIALRGGGSVFVERDKKRDENKITCLLPLAE